MIKIPKIIYHDKIPFSNIDIALFNHTYIKKIFKKNLKHYDILKERNAFINNYFREFVNKDGQDLFDDARDTLCHVINGYDNVESMY